jgi:two-component system chemotaxis response regulator CheB
MSLRVLIADDSALFRRAISDVLAALPEVELVGSAANGRLALQKVRELKPDVLTLDLEMPEIDGLGVLDALRQTGDKVAVIVVSALTRRGGDLTLRALEKGAFDFITKPDTTSAEESRAAIRRELAPRLRTLGHRVAVRDILNRPTHPPASAAAPRVAPLRAEAVPSSAELSGIASRMNRLAATNKPELVLVGVSTGGPNALAKMLPQLPRDIGVPILIVQHMPPVFTQSLADSLAARCGVRVREAAHGEPLVPNTAYIAPGGRQMRLAIAPDGSRIAQITDDPPENNCRPSVDYLFRSVANLLPGRAMAVILTGMGNDGTLGLRLLKRQGCFVIAQDEASCVVYGMPKSAVDAGVTDVILPLEAIGGRIVTTVRGGKA